MQQGYIKLYRCMLDKPWSKHPEYVALWIYCLMRGNYTETDIITRTGTRVHLMPGQFVASREQISINTGIQESKVERILKVFKSEQQIEQQNCGKFRIISILNWDKFQLSEQQIEQQMNNRRTTDEQQMNTDNKVKKEKKVKEKNIGVTRFEICIAWKAFLEMRKLIKKPMTDYAMKLCVNELVKLEKEGNDPVLVLNQSIGKNWAGVFPLKNKQDAPIQQQSGTATITVTDMDRERIKRAEERMYGAA